MFAAYKIFWHIFQPANLLMGMVLLGAVLSWGRGWRWGRRLITVAAIGLLLIGPVPLVEWLAMQLENRFPAARPLPDEITGIIVLGGSLDPVLSANRETVVIGGDAERLTEFIRLALRYPHARLVFTGGSGSVSHPELKETAVAQRLFTEMGLDTHRILFEDQSRTTWENAAECTRRLNPNPQETWLLVTSALHMPRAVASFRAFGWSVLPVPTSYHTHADSPRSEWDFTRSLRRLQNTSNEILGLVGYYWLGRTREIFPGPSAPFPIPSQGKNIIEIKGQ